MKQEMRHVDVSVRNSIPKEDETILTDAHIDMDLIVRMDVYFRKPEDCPFNRGNWVIDIYSPYDQLFCLKLPKEMAKEQVLSYIKPITDELNKKKADIKPAD